MATKLKRAPVEKDQKLLIRYGVSTLVGSNLVGSVFISGYFAYIGIGETLNGILMAIPVLATIFQPVGAMICAATGGLKKNVVAFSVCERLFFSALYFLPLLFVGQIRGVMVAVLFLLANVSTAIITPNSNEWMMRLVPPEKRHDFFARRETAMMVGLVITFLAGGWLMDFTKDRGLQLQSYFVLAAILSVLAVVILSSLARLGRPPEVTHEKVHISMFLIPLRDKRFMLVMAVVAIYQMAQQLVGPYWSIYQLNTLKMSYTFINMLTVVCSIIRMVVLRFCMQYFRNRSWSWLFGISQAITGLAFLLYGFTNHANGHWYIWIPVFVVSLGASFLSIGLLNFQYDNIDREDRSMHMAVGAVITGLVGFLAALVGGAVLEGVNALRAALPWFGLAGQQVQMFISGGLFLLSWLLMIRLKKKDLIR